MKRPSSEKLSIEINGDILTAYHNHARLIGHLTIAWNTAQHAVYSLFEIASDLTPEAAQAIFFAVKSDSAQRDITLALCQVEMRGEDSDLLPAVENGIRGLNWLAGDRNAAIHTMWDIASAATKGVWVPEPEVLYHHKRLGPDATRQFRDAWREVTQITYGLNEVFLAYIGRKTSRQKDALQNLGPEANAPEDNQTSTRKGRRHPPPPSRK